MDLGPPEVSYGASRRFLASSYFAMVMFFGLTGFLGYMGYKVPPKDSGEVLAAVSLTGGFLAGGLWAVWNFLRWRSVRLELCRQGIRFQHQGRQDDFTWIEVDSIQAGITDHTVNGVYAGRHYHVVVKLQDGRRLHLHNSIR